MAFYPADQWRWFQCKCGTKISPLNHVEAGETLECLACGKKYVWEGNGASDQSDHSDIVLCIVLLVGIAILLFTMGGG